LRGDIDLPQIVGEREAQSELLGYLVAPIGEDLVREMTGADQVAAMLGQLRRDCHERRPECGQLRQDGL
jgi:hypothetical protein